VRRVVLESPYAGPTPAAIAHNVEYARACVADSLRRGEAPIASHLLHTQPGILLDGDPDERKLGIAAGLAWVPFAAASVFYTDLGWSRGMVAARQAAADARTPIEVRGLGTGWIPWVEPPVCDVGIDPGTTGAIAALDADGEVKMLGRLPTAELGPLRKVKGRAPKRSSFAGDPDLRPRCPIVDGAALARLLLDLACAHSGLGGPSPIGRPLPPRRRLRVWVEQVNPTPGEGAAQSFAFGGVLRAVQVAVEVLAAERPDVIVTRPEPAAASGRSAVNMVTSPEWARSAGLEPNRDRDARLAAYHAAALRRWPALDRREVPGKNECALLGPRGAARHDKAAALWIADHGRKSGAPC